MKSSPPLQIERERTLTIPEPVTKAPSTHRPGHAPRPIVADILGALAGLGFGLTLALVVINESSGSLASPGGWFSAAGRVSGFLGSYLMLLMVFLIARIPWLERAVGQDQLVRWHRRIGGWPIVLIALHVVLVTLGYSKVDHVSWVRQMDMFIFHYPDILASLVGFALLIMVGISSYRIVRRRQAYETWWIVHLYTYLALALAFAHQVVTGLAFLNHPLAKSFWIGLWLVGALAIAAFRFGLPLIRNLRAQLKVVSVDEDVPGVYSIVLTGKRLSNLAVSGGQFFQWRFLTKSLWWQAHPYSLSALPNPPFIRVTIKDVGDHSGAIAQLRPGTRVFAEGPYGTFTHHRRTTDQVVLIGAGVGITPLRALLEDLPAKVGVTVITRGSQESELVHRDEISDLVAERGGVLHELVGSRHGVKLDAAAIRRMVPGVAVSDVYICGPAAFTDHVASTMGKLGVPNDRIHTEAFAF
ncbi:MAG TPA: ferric reductase-like transmembrane domain-containing protein [Acidimicrobiales bacterium]|nr:ferric reductase-like transmembrane domain-containing protein [Acidimicrobiales bacterium]